jgi:hypothetical protein
MQGREEHAKLNETLQAIAAVLEREFRALSTLNGPLLEETTAEKSELEIQLRTFKGKVPDRPEIKRAISHIKASALVNQALLVHARACLKGALQIATGSGDALPSYSRAAGGSAPVRVNLRG